MSREVFCELASKDACATCIAGAVASYRLCHDAWQIVPVVEQNSGPMSAGVLQVPYTWLGTDTLPSMTEHPNRFSQPPCTRQTHH